MNIIITGASSGLGADLAVSYAAKNNNLLLIARNEKRLNLVAKKCQDSGANVFAKICDVKEEKKLEKILLEFDKKHNTDLIFANAGISAGTSGGDENIEQVKNIFNVNITGAINSIYPLIPEFKKRKSGQIAILSSMAGFKALPSAPAYSASKACVRYLGDGLRGDLKKHGVNVSIICPGYINTPMTKVNKFPMPFLMSTEKAIKIIKKGLKKNKAHIVFPKFFYLVINLSRALPTSIGDRIYASLPKK
jgi:short-subunit dehydrogenase